VDTNRDYQNNDLIKEIIVKLIKFPH